MTITPDPRNATGDAAPNTDAAAPGFTVRAPVVEAPKGGGAIRGIGETFAAGTMTGTASTTVPIPVSPGRSGFGPTLSLSYGSGSGDGPFGLGWSLALPSITRKTEKGLPRYRDSGDDEPGTPDVFIMSGADDLVPALANGAQGWRPVAARRALNGNTYAVSAYRPRVEGLFARIEWWRNVRDANDVFWRSISKDNVTTWYGLTPASRIADPSDATHVFSWLACRTHDDKGGLIEYDYKAEDSAGIPPSALSERNRTATSRAAGRYPARIRYGHRGAYHPLPDAAQAVPLPADPCFEVVFDYGEYDLAAPVPGVEVCPWPARPDPFSSHRPGFELRTYRRCRRVLMFHHFPAEAEVGANCLVRSTELTYADNTGDPRDPFHSLLASVVQAGWRRAGAGYLRQPMPALAFGYSRPAIDATVRELDAESLRNLPAGLDGDRYRWVDLDGEGLSGILSEQGGEWFYKANLGPAPRAAAADPPPGTATFGPVERVGPLPSPARLNGGHQQLLSLSGNGALDIVDYQGPAPGFAERTEEGGWSPWTPFEALPTIDWADPELKFIDLTGDGLPDLLIAEGDAFRWHPSLAKAGFAAALRVPRAPDDEHGPTLVFADGTESIFLADMTGDGLTDLVRIRNGEACYWPNQGHGRFGAKVAMDNAPWFDTPDLFSGRRLRLADIDGSGTADLVYFASRETRLYFNLSGNAWGAPRALDAAPAWDALSTAQVIDLKGNGTSCLVWSSPLPGQARAPLRWADPMGGRKPHLLTSIDNHLGRETRITYAPSTRFYVAAKLAGTPWLTRLPFPVQVVEQVEQYDWIARNRFVTRYAYHHGFFDGVERQFRGFGLVEQWDGEALGALSPTGAFPDPANADASSDLPPVCTRTWFHTGAWAEGADVTRSFASAYFAEPGFSAAQNAAMRLPLTQLPLSILLADGSRLPHEIDPDEAREAARALRGSVLRKEVYSQDGSVAAGLPYTATENNFTIEMLQPGGPNRHAAFLTRARESLDLGYERALYAVGPSQVTDPRVGHSLTLEADTFGNVTLAASVAYGRRHADPGLAPADQAVQGLLLLTAARTGHTAAVQTEDGWRTPLEAETHAYQLLRCVPSAALPGGTSRFGFDELAALLAQAGDGTHDLPYEDVQGAGATQAHPYRRLIARSRRLYLADDLFAPLPLGQMGALGLPFESYRQALTPGLIAAIYGAKLPAAQLTAVLQSDAGYRDLDGDGGAWVASGRSYYSPNPGARDSAFASQHFHLVQSTADAFGNPTRITHDADDLLVISTQDTLGNLIAAQNDYRVLLPATVTDANGNRTMAAFDALGRVAGTAVTGKTSETLGDTLVGFIADLTPAQIGAYVDSDDPRVAAPALLASASTRFVYDEDRFAVTRAAAPADPTRWQPTFASSIAREMHVVDLGEGQVSALQIGFAYSDSFGRVAQSKLLAEPPLAGAAPRWAGTGWTVYDNKGKPVRQYEPFFSGLATRQHAFEFDVTVGVSPIFVRDPLGRTVATVHPNQSWEKLVIDPWRTEAWDVNDTVLVSDPRADAGVGAWLARLDAADLLPTWYQQRISGALGAAAQAAAQSVAPHAATSARTVFDPFGRAVVNVADNGVAGRYSTRSVLDVQGRLLALVDELGRIAARHDWDMLGTKVHQASMEAGERWLMQDCAGQPLRLWDSRGHALRTGYDALRRPVAQFVLGTDPALSDPRTLAAEVLFARTFYGEGQPSDQALNLRGRIHQQFDCAGVLTQGGIDPRSGQPVAYDFKGNLLESVRQTAADYKGLPDWSGPVALDASGEAMSTRWDALNRPIASTAPDGSITRPAYDAGGRLNGLAVNLQGAAAVTPFVTGIAYNARGQRVAVTQGNGARTTFDHDPLTFRLAQLVTTRSGFGAGQNIVQQLTYTDDPVGNITHLQDDADIQNVIYFRNRRVEPSADYVYDPIYRLTRASGREHLGQLAAAGLVPGPSSYNDQRRVGLPQPGDGNAMGTYVEQYRYDAAGNLLGLQHTGSDPANPGWSRAYTYAETSQIEPAIVSNRLTRTVVNPNGGAPLNEDFGHDPQGNMTRMPQLQALLWDFLGRLRSTRRQAVNGGDAGGQLHQGERTYHVCDAAGKRLRKVTERANGTRMKERLYLGAFELYREYDGSGAVVTLERQTLHVMDGERRVAMVETRTAGNDGSPAQLVRYQYDNHLGSACLELDGRANVISYEEYHPYGSTAYQAVDAGLRAAAKRYRFAGRERDEETGLAAHGARYAALWLGRWISADPAGMVDGTNLYAFVRDNPVRRVDPGGTDSTTANADDQKGKPAAPEPAAGKPVPLTLKLDPPNFLSSSYSQSLGVIPSGREDVEINAYGIGARSSGLGQRAQFGGGLLLGQISDRRAVDGAPGFDVGGAVSGSLTSQGTIDGDSKTRGVGASLLLHYASKFADGGSWGLGGYGSVGGASQISTGGDRITAPTASVTGVLGYEPEPADDAPEPTGLHFSGFDLNPALSYTGRGQLSQSPTLSSVYTLGGYAGVNLGIGEHWSVLPEAGAFYSHGDADSHSNSTQSAQSLTLRAGVAATYNWLDGGASHATNSVSFGAWYTEERGSVGGASDPSSASASPAGDFVTRSITFGATFGFRHLPFFGP